jgi:hypothetical protein
MSAIDGKADHPWYKMLSAAGFKAISTHLADILIRICEI